MKLIQVLLVNGSYRFQFPTRLTSVFSYKPYCWPILWVRRVILVNVSLSVHCLSHGLILKTEQNRPTVTAKHY